MKFMFLTRTSTILWAIWGIVHMFAGVMTISLGTPEAIGGIADAVDPSSLDLNYPAALGGILGQHGWNLFWFGLVTLIGSIYIWRGSVVAIFVTAMVGGFADMGYFLFVDLGGFVNFVPGTVMTIICAAAILLSFGAYFKFEKNELTS